MLMRLCTSSANRMDRSASRCKRYKQSRRKDRRIIAGIRCVRVHFKACLDLGRTRNGQCVFPVSERNLFAVNRNLIYCIALVRRKGEGHVCVLIVLAAARCNRAVLARNDFDIEFLTRGDVYNRRIGFGLVNHRGRRNIKLFRRLVNTDGKDIANSSSTTIALMERFETVDDLANSDLEELTAFVTETGRGRFADPAATAKAVRAAAKGSYRLPKTVNDTVNQAMSVSIASMRALKEQVKVLDKAIEQQFEIIPNTLTSIPGIGKVYSAGIIAEIGDIHRFDSQASVAKFAGLVWHKNQSGEFEAEHSRMIKSGNRYLRYYLLEAANSVRRCDSEFRRYYDLKFKEVNKYQHKRALALTARKLVRLVFRLLKDNRLYIPPES